MCESDMAASPEWIDVVNTLQEGTLVGGPVCPHRERSERHLRAEQVRRRCARRCGTTAHRSLDRSSADRSRRIAWKRYADEAVVAG